MTFTILAIFGALIWLVAKAGSVVNTAVTKAEQDLRRKHAKPVMHRGRLYFPR